MSPNKESNAPSTAGQGPGRGRGRGRGRNRGRGRGSTSTEEPEALLTIRAARQVSQRHIANLSAADKKELLSRKRQNELVRVLLPDAPPRKRRTLNASPEREACVMVVDPLSSAQDFTVPPQPSTSTSRELTPPLIIVPRDVEFVPFVSYEVEVPASSSSSSRRQNLSIDAITMYVNDYAMDSDSDADMDDNEDFQQLPTDRQIEIVTDNDLTPQQVQILQTEDTANDQALQNLLPNEDCFTFNWNKDRSTFKSPREQFTGTPGPTFDVTENSTPTDIFDKMFDVEFIDLLCKETNRYTSQKIESRNDNLSANSRQHRWTPTDRPEMISFLSIMILQGLYPLSNEESYFTFNGFGTMPYFSKIMSYNRYALLKSMLHFIDNDKMTDIPTISRLCKIKPITDYFNDKFSSLYYPRQEISIDESLLKWHRRLSFAQKINSKAAQVGIKTYKLCESSSGYLWQFSVYAGKKKQTMTDRNDADDDTEIRPDHTEQMYETEQTSQTEQTNQTEKANQTEQTNQTEQKNDKTDFQPTNATAKIVF